MKSLLFDYQLVYIPARLILLRGGGEKTGRRGLLSSRPIYKIFVVGAKEDRKIKFDPENNRASELGEAFWDNIPGWKLWKESKPCQVFGFIRS